VRAVLNAVILAFDDRYQGRTADRDATRRAFAHLWQVRCRSGDQKGPWDALDFGLEPWESNCARYRGADQAAIAVGMARGYYTPGADANTEDRGNLLRGYLRAGPGPSRKTEHVPGLPLVTRGAEAYGGITARSVQSVTGRSGVANLPGDP
jgi:hypothetical protein